MFPEIKTQAEIDREQYRSRLVDFIGDLAGGISLFAILMVLAFAPLLIGG